MFQLLPRNLSSVGFPLLLWCLKKKKKVTTKQIELKETYMGVAID